MNLKCYALIGFLMSQAVSAMANAEEVNEKAKAWSLSASGRLFLGTASGSYDASGGFVAPMLSVSALHQSGWFVTASTIENMKVDFEAYGRPGSEAKSDREVDVGYVLSPNIAVAAGIKNISVKMENTRYNGTQYSDSSSGTCPNLALALRTKFSQTLGGYGNFSAFTGCQISDSEEGGTKDVKTSGGAIELGLTQAFSDQVSGLMSVRYMPYSGNIGAFKSYFGITAGVSGQF